MDLIINGITFTYSKSPYKGDTDFWASPCISRKGTSNWVQISKNGDQFLVISVQQFGYRDFVSGTDFRADSLDDAVSFIGRHFKWLCS